MNRIARRVLAGALVFLFCSAAYAADYDYTLKLQSGEFVPQKMRTVPAAAAALQDRYVFMQFDEPLTDQQHAQLENEGIKLLHYIPNLAFTSRLERPVEQDLMDRFGIRWFGEIQPVQKISPAISEYGIFDWARRGGNLVQFVVVLHPDQDGAYWMQELEQQFGAQVIGLEPSMNAIDLILPEPAYYRLSEIPAVAWIEQAMPYPEETNDDARANSGANIVQMAPYNLDGSGVTVAEWDGGGVELTHPDLAGRIVSMDFASTAAHATHVAGTVMGNGTQSGGVYRGMAPNATLLSWLWWNNGSEMQSEYSVSISQQGARIATNSWGYGVGDPATESACESTLGNYWTVCGTIDNVVRGASGEPISILWSAGNQRGSSSKYCGSIGWTFNTIGTLGVSKNVVTVGAINSNNNSMTSFSSWGPTDDGRIKPDVVGPGCQSTGDGGIRSTVPGGGYGVMCGTSMSTPATAGVMALMHEQHDLSFGGLDDPLPSTYKGILINSADNLGPDGPDYVYGHGVVNAVSAVRKVAAGEPSYIESEITTGTNHLYDLTVGGNVDKLKVTLVWDDPGGIASVTQHLVNDLDLVLIDPFTNEEFPWVLDPDNPINQATKGVDRLNNVETVEIDLPTAGLWKAKVTGFNVPDGPQSYSLIFTPDSIHTPGNLAALAVYDNGAIEQDPGLATDVQFWVTNIGANLDSMTVDFSDTQGWLDDTLTDPKVILAPFDSAYFAFPVNIPALALAGEFDVVTCNVVSLSDSLVTASIQTTVVTGGVYDIALMQPAEDTVASPDTVLFTIPVHNVGNDTDVVTIQPVSDSGWQMLPSIQQVEIDPLDSLDVSFSIVFPAEVPDGAVHTITVDATSNGGAADQTSFAMVTANPNMPPELVSPAELAYTQSQLPTFEWQGPGDSYTLYIAEDSLITNTVRVYPGLLSPTHTLPGGDELADGGYYWAVRAHVGADSSSLQRHSRQIVIDNLAPRNPTPTSPVNGAYVAQPNVTLQFSTTGKAVVPETTPEFGYIEISTDSLFGFGTEYYGPFTGVTYVLPSPLTDDRWYWRVYRVDSAGNVSDTSAPATFVLDTQTPDIPEMLTPADEASFMPDTVVFTWSTPLPGAIESAPEYYYVHVSNLPNFAEYTIFTGYVHDDTLLLPGTELVEGTTYYWRMKAFDSAGHFTDYSPSRSFTYRDWLCGDVSNDGAQVNLTDVTLLVNYLFVEGPAPEIPEAADVSCDGTLNLTDLTLLINHLFINQSPLCCQL